MESPATIFKSEKLLPFKNISALRALKHILPALNHTKMIEVMHTGGCGGPQRKGFAECPSLRLAALGARR